MIRQARIGVARHAKPDKVSLKLNTRTPSAFAISICAGPPAGREALAQCRALDDARYSGGNVDMMFEPGQ